MIDLLAHFTAVNASKQYLRDGGTRQTMFDTWPGVAVEYTAASLLPAEPVTLVCINQQGRSYFGIDEKQDVLSREECLAFFSERSALESAPQYEFLLQDSNRRPLAWLVEVRPELAADFRPAICITQVSPFDANNLISFGMELHKLPAHDRILRQIAEDNTLLDMYAERFQTLTKREKQVLRLVAADYSSKEIAEALRISQYTVNDHRKNLGKKLETDSVLRLAAVARAFRL